MLVPERHARKLQEREYLQAVAVIVGDAEQRGVGVKREHAKVPSDLRQATLTRRADRSDALPRVAGYWPARKDHHLASEATHSISISIFGSGSAWTTQVVRAG